MNKIIILLSFIFFLNKLYSQWDGNPETVMNPVSSIKGYNPVAVSDGNGGAIIAWISNNSILAQRKSVAGFVKWNSLSTPVGLFSGVTVNITDIASDGAGGAYIAWINSIDQSTSDIYVQHLDSRGNLLFGNQGIKVNSDSYAANTYGRLCAGDNGVIVVWGNENIDSWSPLPVNSKLFVQRFNTVGRSMWPDSLTVSAATGNKFRPCMVSDGNNGAFIGFTDTRNSGKDQYGNYTNFDIYMQHIDAAGQRLWGNEDSTVTIEPGNQLTYETTLFMISWPMVSDDSTGCMMVYMNDDGSVLYAQRINNNGKAWSQAVGFVGAFNTKYTLRIITDGNHGIVATWHTVPPSGSYIFAQRVAGDGSLPWGSTPHTVNGPADIDRGSPFNPALAADGAGNYVICWKSNWNGDSEVDQLKAQKISANGSYLWDANGAIIYNNTNVTNRTGAPAMVQSDDTNMVVIWPDTRDTIPGGINAARIKPDGTLYNNPVADFQSTGNGNWNDPSIWTGGVIPVEGSNVVVTTNVTVNENIICNSIKVIPPGSLTVAAGAAVTVIE